MRTLLLIIAVAGAYMFLRGWPDGPGLLLRSCLAVATVVAGLVVWGSRREKSHARKRMSSLRKATLLDYFSLGIVIVFVEACFVVFTSTLAQPAQNFALIVHDGIAEMNNPNRSEEENADDLNTEPTFGGDQSGPWIFKKNLERDLPKQSNHKPTNKPEAFVELANDEDVQTLLNSRIYLSSFAFSQFNGTSWSAAPSARTVLRAPIRFSQEANDRPIIRHRVYHTANPTGQNVFTALHGNLSTDVSELTRLAESVFLLPEPESIDSGYAYNATSQPILFSDLLKKEITPATAVKGELALPDELIERLTETATTFKKKPDTTSQLLALRSYLQENYQYSLETTNKDGVNPLENFLYREKRGYCEHFATAAALFCRAIGIPSRIAYGWSGGRLYTAQNMFVFRAKDAHAWTEIKIEGYGWVIFDTTPPDGSARPETVTAPENEKAPNPSEALHLDSEEDEDDLTGTSLGTGVNQVKLLIALGILCLCSLGFFTLRYLKRVKTTPDGRPITHSQPGYLLHFKQACATLGYPMPLGRTLRQHIAQLKNTELAPEFLDGLLEYHYQMTYAGAKKNPTLEKQLHQTIQQWKNSKSNEKNISQ